MQGNYAYVEKLNRHSRIMPLRGKIATLGRNSFVAPNSSVIGDVQIGNQSSVWYNTVLRGDVNSIVIGDESVISDRSVVHCSSGNGPKGAQPTVVGNRVYVGPGSIIHACKIEDDVHIGAGSIVYDGAVVEAGAQLEAGSLVTAGKRVPAGQLWAGSPAKFVREVSAADKEMHQLTISDNNTLSAEHEVQTSKSAKQQHIDQLENFAHRRERPENILNPATAHN
ncbi:trimeric LpxA-like domain-containing protein [Heterostelium album PN500]|uniref:Trimeric LpxA-like domain-containing protein n=1 Tax=Heterostelium pallidum (strain ATCC 26659 / Pp 5 / PN500) TaxID=670386 RepID=D3BNI8_HETP5|nr:trimeric LpxA-like domain-containing protein [Heterostelium album PN500]EFA76939.1 trimeric LpxA-like domain-containing protein [Heterostelium album PN500]|eukprot:XP_020429071.1 trimeric LpxA-like domain-containing protein [Heterostelium album PN500]